MIHYFDTDVATEYGIIPAVILTNIAHWVAHNEANGQNMWDGEYWTYNSVQAFSELFPYATPKQIRSALDTLRENELIKTGNFNELPYDRTLWYTLTEKGKTLCLSGQIHLPQRAKTFAPEGKPIPNNKPDNKPDYKTYIVEIVDYLNEKAGTRYRASTPSTQRHLNARLSEGFTVEDCKTVIDKKCKDWIGTEWQKYLRPETLFGSKFESYLNEKKSGNSGRESGDWDYIEKDGKYYDSYGNEYI